MILGIDVGNSIIKVGLFDEEKNDVLRVFNIKTNVTLTADEISVKLKSIFFFEWEETIDDISGVIVSSVVPGLDEELKKSLEDTFGNSKVLFVSPGIKTNIKINIDNPKELGSDIIVDAVAANHLYKEDVIVCNMGTAIKIFYVSKDRELSGVSIFPGVHIAKDALSNRASKLPNISLEKPYYIVGKNTVESIKGGMFFGFLGAIKELIFRMKKAENENAKVILTGGGAAIFVKALEQYIDVYEENLTIIGLGNIFVKNKDNDK